MHDFDSCNSAHRHGPVIFAQAEFEAKRRTTCYDHFGNEMKIVVPRARLLEVLKSHYYLEVVKHTGSPHGLTSGRHTHHPRDDTENLDFIMAEVEGCHFGVSRLEADPLRFHIKAL